MYFSWKYASSAAWGLWQWGGGLSGLGTQNEKFNSIQILRGLAALLVVIDHTLQHTLTDPPRILGVFGAFGVSIFFVISGFIIAYIHSGGFTPGNFMRRRIMRVVPLYWICTLFLAVCAIVLPSLFKTTVFTPEYLLKSMAFLPMAVPGIPDDWRPLLKPGWSLNYEIFFYVLFSLFWWCRNGLQRTILMSSVLGGLVLGAFFVPRHGSVTAFYLNFNLMPFIAGMWIAELQRRGVWARLSVHSLPVLVFAMLLGIATLFTVDFTQGPLFIEFLAYLIASVLLVITALCVERWLHDLSPRNLLLLIGDSSYSLYLTHMFLVGAGWAVFNRLGLSEKAFPLAATAIVIGSLVAARISYLVIERPFTRLGSRRSQRKKVDMQPG